MSFIDVTAVGFGRGVVRRAGLVPAPLGRLALAAAVVGESPLGTLRGWVPGAPMRPYLELQWRIAMVLANVDDTGRSYRRSATYDRLDPSEKSAVSYFLGMAQAALVMDSCVDIPFIAHVDAILATAGMPARGRTRPDFLGLRSRNRVCAAIEAKGRTKKYEAGVVVRAKGQAAALPAITGFAAPLQIASLASFDAAGNWQSHIEDPPRQRPSTSTVEPGVVIVEHYRPVVDAIRSAPEAASVKSEGDQVVLDLPDVGVTIRVPSPIFSLFEELVPAREPLRVGLSELSAAFVRAIDDLALDSSSDSFGDLTGEQAGPAYVPPSTSSPAVSGSGISVVINR